MTRKIALKTVFIAQNPFQNSKLTFKTPKSFLQLQNLFRDAKILFYSSKISFETQNSISKPQDCRKSFAAVFFCSLTLQHAKNNTFDAEQG